MFCNGLQAQSLDDLIEGVVFVWLSFPPTQGNFMDSCSSIQTTAWLMSGGRRVCEIVLQP